MFVDQNVDFDVVDSKWPTFLQLSTKRGDDDGSLKDDDRLMNDFHSCELYYRLNYMNWTKLMSL